MRRRAARFFKEPDAPPRRALFQRARRAAAPRAFSESRTRRRAARFFREPDALPRSPTGCAPLPPPAAMVFQAPPTPGLSAPPPPRTSVIPPPPPPATVCQPPSPPAHRALLRRAGRAAAPRAFQEPDSNGLSRPPPHPPTVCHAPPPPPLQQSVTPPAPTSVTPPRHRAARFFRELDAPPRRALF